MVLSGLLDPSEQKSHYIKTKEDSRVCLPVMCFVIKKNAAVYIWVSPAGVAFLSRTEALRISACPPTLILPSTRQSAHGGSSLLRHFDLCLIRSPNQYGIVSPGFIFRITTGTTAVTYSLYPLMSLTMPDLALLGVYPQERLESTAGALLKWSLGKIDVLGLSGGHDVFGDGSLVMIPAPGVSFPCGCC